MPSSTEDTYLRPEDMEIVKYREIVELIADILPMTKQNVRIAIDVFIRVLLEAAASGKRVSVPGFGMFRLVRVRGKWVLRFRQSYVMRPKMHEEQRRRGFKETKEREE